MSTQAKLTLAGSILFTTSVVTYIHVTQKLERDSMKEGVKMFEAKEKERQQKLAEYAEQEKFVKDMKELQKSQATKQ